MMHGVSESFLKLALETYFGRNVRQNLYFCANKKLFFGNIFLGSLWIVSAKWKQIFADHTEMNIHTEMTRLNIWAVLWHSEYGYWPVDISIIHIPNAYTSTLSLYRSSYISGAMNSGVPTKQNRDNVHTYIQVENYQTTYWP